MGNIQKTNTHEHKNSTIFENKSNYNEYIKSYKVDQKYAFMCYFDIDEVTITNSFKPYFDLCLRIYEVIQSGTIIEEVNKLKYDEAELESLNDEKIAMKTYVILTYINNAYLPAIEDKVLPDSLAIPLLKVCNILEIRPCWTYSNNTHCVEVIDKAQPITFENTRMKITHTNTETEEWFYRVSYIVDIRVCEIIDVIYESNHILYKYENKGEIDFDSIIKEDQEKLSAIMDKMVDILTFVRSTARKIFTNVVPTIFYGNLRNYVRGYSHYGGVRLGSSLDSPVYHFPGGSAGQNPFFFCIKALFSIKIPEYLKQYHQSLMDGFRKPHISFIENLGNISLFPKLENYKYTEEQYKKCKSLLNDFYIYHKAYVTKFIEEPATLDGVDITKIKGSGDSELDWVKNLNVLYKLDKNELK